MLSAGPITYAFRHGRGFGQWPFWGASTMVRYCTVWDCY